MDDQSRLYGILLLGIALTGTLLYNRPATPPDTRVREVPSVPAEAETTSGAPVPPSTDALELLARFLGVPVDTGSSDAELLRTVAAGAERRGEVDVDFVVATIPDWVDSNARWLSDGVLDAIQRAMAQSGYVLDRFRFPDLRSGVRPSAAASDERGSRHEREPGVILFREAQWAPSNGPAPDVIILFLVAETATSGIHQEPFRRAATFATAWHEAVRRERTRSGPLRLRVLGPTFSGSAPSLRMGIETAIDDARERGLQMAVDVVSGSATSDGNKGLIEGAVADTRYPVRFRATVLPDSVAQAQLMRYVCGLLPHSEEATVAILVEGNTGYGRNLADQAAQSRGGCGRTLTLPFPLHISRLRGNGGESPGPGGGAVSEPLVSLDLQDSGFTEDRIPTISPGTTLPYVELVLRSILDTVRRERVAAVGLYATDTRDKLFLAREVSRRSPNVLLFTLESDLLYSHPEYGPYMRGTIVASSYPVFNGSQGWTHPRVGEIGRQQFTSTNAHGAYNATVALLNYDLDGRPLDGPSGVASLLDYRAPSDRGCRSGFRPPLWISVAARDGLWPIVFFEPFPCADERPGGAASAAHYVFPWRPVAAADAGEDIGRRGVALLHPSGAAVATFVTVTIFVAAHVLAFVFVTRRRGRDDWRPLTKPFLRWFAESEAVRTDPVHGRHEHRRYLLACFVALAIAGTACNTLFAIWWVNDGGAWMGRSGLEAITMRVLLVAGTLVVAASWLLVLAIIVHLASFVGRRPSTWVARLSLVLAVCFTVFHVWPSLHHVGLWVPNGDEWRWWLALHFERATNPGNWISPTVPILLVATPLYLWSVLHLGRLTRPRDVTPAASGELWTRLARGGGAAWPRLRAMLHNSNRGLPVSLALTAALLTFVPKVLIGYDVVTFEGVLAGELIDAGVFVAQFVIVLTLLQGVYTWTLMRRFLEGWSTTRWWRPLAACRRPSWSTRCPRPHRVWTTSTGRSTGPPAWRTAWTEPAAS